MNNIKDKIYCKTQDKVWKRIRGEENKIIYRVNCILGIRVYNMGSTLVSNRVWSILNEQY